MRITRMPGAALRTLAAVAIAGILAMHGMDAGSSAAHAMAMPTAPAEAASTEAPSPDAASHHPSTDESSDARIGGPAHTSAHASGVMCALAPAPVHVLPQPAATTVAVVAEAAPSVVASVEARAAAPPSLTALGVCRR